jgi:hypothetical protein
MVNQGRMVSRNRKAVRDFLCGKNGLTGGDKIFQGSVRFRLLIDITLIRTSEKGYSSVDLDPFQRF